MFAWPIGWVVLRLVRRAPRACARGTPADPPALRLAPGRSDASDPAWDRDHLPQSASSAGRRRAGGGGGRTDGRCSAFGFGSGSTPEEAGLFGAELTDDATRQARFAEALRVIRATWSGDWSEVSPRFFSVPPHRALPIPPADLPDRCWVAVNSAGSARIAGLLRFNMLFSHLRTPEQYRQYSAAYREAGGAEAIAANRPVFVGPDDRAAFEVVEPWRSGRSGGGSAPRARSPPRPTSPTTRRPLAHPINFLVGGPETVARSLLELHAETPFDVLNAEVRWAGLSHEQTLDSLRRLIEDVAPRLALAGPATAQRRAWRIRTGTNRVRPVPVPVFQDSKGFANGPSRRACWSRGV